MTDKVTEEKSHLIEERAPLFEQMSKRKGRGISLWPFFKKTYARNASKNQILQPEQILSNLKNTLMTIGSQGKNWRHFDDLKIIEIVPLYAPGQYSRDEKYIQTSIAF
ncbi:MAG: hypothetical protein NTV04_19490 [Deltaproteobacteria bacterium]|nr:hypothetical protein [Deltaproteobacteria bacterium]